MPSSFLASALNASFDQNIAAAAGVIALLELGKAEWLVLARQREARRALLLGRRNGIAL